MSFCKNFLKILSILLYFFVSLTEKINPNRSNNKEKQQKKVREKIGLRGPKSTVEFLSYFPTIFSLIIFLPLPFNSLRTKHTLRLCLEHYRKEKGKKIRSTREGYESKLIIFLKKFAIFYVE